MKEPPDAIWLQFYGDGDAEELEAANIQADDVTWASEKVFDSDIKYVIDKPKKRRPRK